jgi:bifunctional non-homologous end joining protein LigD
MALVKYKQKRNFKSTTEPKGRKESGSDQLAFVVQRHKASRLHYDFRLELGGVLKSWAVPKGPSMNPGDKRLAMMVEDHPYAYKDFEGVIPEGNYGAGIVEIWDKGHYTDADNSPPANMEKTIKAGLKAGNLKFVLHGKKLKGEFALVKMKGGDENAWLLIKHKDKFALSKKYESEEYTPSNSPINKWKEKTEKKKAAPPGAARVDSTVKSKHLKAFVKPMLAKETDKAFDDPNWIFEIKWDGYRALCQLKGSDVQLYSRNGISLNEAYPVLLPELKKLKINALLDGEIVATNEQGVPDFQLLQDYPANHAAPLYYYVFDLLSLNNKNTCGLSLIQRKDLLKRLLGKGTYVKYSDHVRKLGISFFKATAEKHLEGMMAKRADSLYFPGQRTDAWLKVKHQHTADVLIAGYTKPKGARRHFGALVLAEWKQGKLAFVGHTGTGFTDKSLSEVFDLLQPLVSGHSPFKERVETNAPVTWVKPSLACEVRFSEWTRDNRMRHPVFLHMRPDKSFALKTRGTKVPQQTLRVPDFDISHPDKVFWPGEGITKGDMISYYQSISKIIVPYLKDRPEAMNRNPNGIADKGFYQKESGPQTPAWVDTVSIYSHSAGKNINYILCNNRKTLAYLNNLGCIELNPWHSRIQALDRPDYLVLDIDPGEKNTFEQVIETAQVIHEILRKIKVADFCKTSGASGLHIYIPAERKYTYEQLRTFSQLICTLAREKLPHFTTLERSLSKRGKAMIYLDCLQNRQGQTIASAYSIRPQPGATVSAPLLWKEVKPGLHPSLFTIHTMPKRIEKKGDLFHGVLSKGIDLRRCLNLLGA